MKNNKLVDELKELREKVCIYEKLQAERNDLIEKLRTAEQRQPHELIDFDRSKKQAFIEEKAGKPPKKPVKILKLAVPVYAAMIKEYEKEYSLYKSRCNDAENEYYNLYSEERMRIDANEREQINNDITRLRQSCDEIELKYHAAKQEVDDNSLLGNKYKNTAIIDELIGFLQDERADNIKEAINLYHEEQHRTRIEEYAKEQLRLTQEASKSAQEAARYAQEASKNAQEAASKAEAAIDRANEAYYRADEAFNKADDAYFEAHNHS